jgi:mannose-1-phosphate guanylyltransferase
VKAVILVGGEGTRLRPLTCHCPKPMQPMVNRPFIEHVFTHLARHGVRDIILSMCYLPAVIAEHFGDGRRFGVNLTYVCEDTPLGTAGAVKNVEQHLDDTFLVLNGDILTDLDLTAMLAFHRQRRAALTIALTPVEDVRAYGLVELGERRRIRRFIEKPQSLEGITTNLVNAGTYILEPYTLRYAPANEFYMFERGLFPTLLEQGEPLFGYASDAYWLDIGTPQKYQQGNFDILAGAAQATLPGTPVADGVSAGAGCQIAPDAHLIGPVVLGERCQIGAGARIVGPAVLGDDCVIGPGASVERSVLWQRVQVSGSADQLAPAALQGCVVANDTVIGAGCFIGEQVVISNHCVVGAENRLDRGLRLWPHRSLPPKTITF